MTSRYAFKHLCCANIFFHPFWHNPRFSVLSNYSTSNLISADVMVLRMTDCVKKYPSYARDAPSTRKRSARTNSKTNQKFLPVFTCSAPGLISNAGWCNLLCLACANSGGLPLSMDFLFPIDMLPLVVSYMDSVHFLVQTNLASLDSASTASSTCNENAPLLPAT